MVAPLGEVEAVLTLGRGQLQFLPHDFPEKRRKIRQHRVSLALIKTSAEEHYSCCLQNSSILLFLMSLRPKTTKIDLIQFEATGTVS